MPRKLLSVCAGLLFTLTVYAAATDWADHHPDRYIVKKGDTLWSISARFLRSPWHWPQIWQDNPQIKNPHLIYPGDELVVTGGGRGDRLTHGEASIEPHERITDLSEAIQPIPLSAIKQWLSNTRIVGENDYKNAPHVVAIEDGRQHGTIGQLAYVRGLQAQPGDKFALVRPLGRYYDMPPRSKGAVRELYRQGTGPVYDYPDMREGRPAMLWRHGPNEITGLGDVRFLGYEMLDYGTVEVTRSADISSVLITYADIEVKPGDFVLPIDPRPYDDQYVPHALAHVPDNMRVLALSEDTLDASGAHQVVTLSRGAEDGVDNGATFSIYQDGERILDKTDYPEGSFGKFFNHAQSGSRVTLPPEFIGHVMVFRTFPRVSYALVMDTVKPVNMGDFLHDPDTAP